MGVGPIRGGGKSGGPRGAKGPKGAASKGPVSKGTFGKVDRTERLVGPSGAAGTSEASAVSDPVLSQAKDIALALKSGEIVTKGEAARKLVAGILKERMKLHSKALGTKIAEQIQDDPRLARTLERIWQRGS